MRVSKSKKTQEKTQQIHKSQRRKPDLNQPRFEKEKTKTKIRQKPGEWSEKRTDRFLRSEARDREPREETLEAFHGERKRERGETESNEVKSREKNISFGETFFYSNANSSFVFRLYYYRNPNYCRIRKREMEEKKRRK